MADHMLPDPFLAYMGVTEADLEETLDPEQAKAAAGFIAGLEQLPKCPQCASGWPVDPETGEELEEDKCPRCLGTSWDGFAEIARVIREGGES